MVLVTLILNGHFWRYMSKYTKRWVKRVFLFCNNAFYCHVFHRRLHVISYVGASPLPLPPVSSNACPAGYFEHSPFNFIILFKTFCRFHGLVTLRLPRSMDSVAYPRRRFGIHDPTTIHRGETSKTRSTNSFFK